MEGGLDGLLFFAAKVRERAEKRAALGLPPEPAPTRAEVNRRMADWLNQPNPLVAKLLSRKEP